MEHYQEHLNAVFHQLLHKSFSYGFFFFNVTGSWFPTLLKMNLAGKVLFLLSFTWICVYWLLRYVNTCLKICASVALYWRWYVCELKETKCLLHWLILLPLVKEFPPFHFIGASKPLQIIWCCWRKGYSVCLKNPKKRRQESVVLKIDSLVNREKATEAQDWSWSWRW